jgi:predicted solute-binding protein
MNDKPPTDETVLWQRRLASQANNRAWMLAESSQRTPQEDEEMLQAAHAAMHFWKIVGNDTNRAHAALLVAHACALLGMGESAARFLAQAQPVLMTDTAAPWEVALAHAVTANVAAANSDATAHRQHYDLAHERVARLPNPEDRSILEATLAVVPRPQTL